MWKYWTGGSAIGYWSRPPALPRIPRGSCNPVTRSREDTVSAERLPMIGPTAAFADTPHAFYFTLCRYKKKKKKFFSLSKERRVGRSSSSSAGQLIDKEKQTRGQILLSECFKQRQVSVNTDPRRIAEPGCLTRREGGHITFVWLL